MTVDVYGKPGCVQCKYTKKKLEEDGHEVRYHDIMEDQEARHVVEESGQLALPLVVAGDKSWHGFSPDRIKALATAA